TLKRWNLRSTSRGVLIIGTLLIPLNFLATLVISGSEGTRFATTDFRYIAAVAIGLVGFGVMTFFAARALMRDGWWRLWLVVMGTSVGQLIINRMAEPNPSALACVALIALPLAAFLIAMVSQNVRASQWQRLSAPRVEQIFLLLGVGVFSLLAPLGLLLFKADSIPDTLAKLSTALSPVAAVILATGLFVHQRTVSKSLAKIRTVGTTLVLFGSALLTAVVYFAWPEPHMLIAVGLANAAILFGLGFYNRLPILHV
ncbi:MAG: hypothetical protein IH991_16025, partial [Planctomycetes bacterium]|nr:hypothetical protein [Planctomycetota bacterium]